MILSVSRRTDIPCRYAAWFMNRIAQGHVLTRNPMNFAQLSGVALSPDTVDCIVFWTKDPLPLMPHLDTLDALGYRSYFQFTLTPYGGDIERFLRPKAVIEDTFIALSKRIGRQRVVWRYDPILARDGSAPIDAAYHKAHFRRMLDKFAPYTDTVVISFVDMYPRIRKAAIRAMTAGEMAEIAAFIGHAAKERGVNATACCESVDLSAYGIGRSSCIDRERVERVIGCPLDIRRDGNQRKGCGCVESVDIGIYGTCPNGCVYCYAGGGSDAALWRHAAHDPDSALLCGAAGSDERVIWKEMKSNKRRQTTLFDK